MTPWIFRLFFNNCGGPLGVDFASGKPSRLRNSILDSLTELSASRESSGACLGPNFLPFSYVLGHVPQAV